MPSYAVVKRYGIALLAAALTFLFLTTTADAAPGDGQAPASTAQEANCYRSIQLTGDLVCLMRYLMPQQTGTTTPVAPEEWCAQLVDTTGCTSSPVAPDEPTSLAAGVAWITLCRQSGTSTGCFSSSTGTLLQQTAAPRIWYSLGGIYLNPGHSVTWGSTTTQMCIESGTSFATTTQACIAVSFNSAANTQAGQRAQMASDILGMMTTIEADRSLPKNSYVTNFKLTTAARTLALEAYVNMDQVIPQAFQAAAAVSVLTPFSLTATVSPLQKRVNLTATAANWGNFNAAGAEIGGISGGFFSTLMFLLGGLIVGGIAFKVTNEFSLALAALGTTTLLGVFVGGPSVSMIAVTIVCFSFLAGWFILRRIPTG